MEAGLEPIGGLIGRWRGEGTVTWQGQPLTYAEEMSFELGGGGDDFPFLAYAERAWDPDTGTTMHTERGMWRINGENLVDVTLAHPIGVTEIAEGTVDGSRIALTSVRIQIGTHGLPVASLRRDYDLEGDRLGYRIHLATDRVPLFEHLVGSLSRIAAPVG